MPADMRQRSRPRLDTRRGGGGSTLQLAHVPVLPGLGIGRVSTVGTVRVDALRECELRRRDADRGRDNEFLQHPWSPEVFCRRAATTRLRVPRSHRTILVLSPRLIPLIWCASGPRQAPACAALHTF